MLVRHVHVIYVSRNTSELTIPYNSKLLNTSVISKPVMKKSSTNSIIIIVERNTHNKL